MIISRRKNYVGLIQPPGRNFLNLSFRNCWHPKTLKDPGQMDEEIRLPLSRINTLHFSKTVNWLITYESRRKDIKTVSEESLRPVLLTENTMSTVHPGSPTHKRVITEKTYSPCSLSFYKNTYSDLSVPYYIRQVKNEQFIVSGERG